jgi:hypothetical protein
MKGEIDNDFYCSAGFDEGDYCCRNDNGYVYCDKQKCGCYHRKHPTPEQFKEEYGEKYPNVAAVYLLVADVWCPTAYYFCKNTYPENPVICACTPFGKPDDTWRPE